MFIVEKDNKIILANECRATIENTLKFMPEYAHCEIVETDRPIVDLEFADTEEYKAKKEKELRMARIAELKQMLADADYWTSKRIDGEYTDEEWAEKVAIRKAWRAEINELELVVE
jgi:hypothetical protein